MVSGTAVCVIERICVLNIGCSEGLQNDGSVVTSHFKEHSLFTS